LEAEAGGVEEGALAEEFEDEDDALFEVAPVEAVLAGLCVGRL
jgi:hypothetical protein